MELGSDSLLGKLIFTLILMVSPLAGAEIASEGSGPGQVTPGSCPAEVMQENQRIRNYCTEHWQEWELDPPPEHELRQVGECNNPLQQAREFANGCMENAVEFVLMMTFLAVDGSSRMPQPHTPDPDEHVFENGTEQEILARLTENWLRDQCGLGAVDGAAYVFQQCPDEVDHSENSELAVCRNQALQQAREQQECRTSADTRRAMMEGARVQLENQAREIHSERVAREAADAETQRRVRVITQDCRQQAGLLNAEDYDLSSLLNPMSLIRNTTRAASEWATPDPDKVTAFNECARNHSLAVGLPPELSQEGALQNLAERFDAFQCYNAQIRSQMTCEIAAMFAGGGGVLTAAGRATLRRLGRSAAERRASRALADEAVEAAESGVVAAGGGLGVRTLDARELQAALQRNGVYLVEAPANQLPPGTLAGVDPRNPNIILINQDQWYQRFDEEIAENLLHEGTHVRTFLRGADAENLPEAVRRNYDGRRITFRGSVDPAHADLEDVLPDGYGDYMMSDEAEAYLANRMTVVGRETYTRSQRTILEHILSLDDSAFEIEQVIGGAPGRSRFTVSTVYRVDGQRPVVVQIPVSLPRGGSMDLVRDELRAILQQRLTRLTTIERHYN